jgi:PqqD family protein of HPr-rel-A system
MVHKSINEIDLQSPLWTLCGNYQLQWQTWTSDYSVFNPETGETHLISELPAAVLELVAQGAPPLHLIAAGLAADCDVEMTADWERKIAGVLTNLEHIELVERLDARRD